MGNVSRHNAVKINNMAKSTVAGKAARVKRTTKALDAAIVAEIKQAIADGGFQFNPDVIAGRLLQIARRLLWQKRLQ